MQNRWICLIRTPDQMWCITRFYFRTIITPTVYINGLLKCLNNTKARLFAHDTNLTASGDSISDIEVAINSDLESRKNWLVANKLGLNIAKTEFMLIHPKRIKTNSAKQFCQKETN